MIALEQKWVGKVTVHTLCWVLMDSLAHSEHCTVNENVVHDSLNMPELHQDVWRHTTKKLNLLLYRFQDFALNFSDQIYTLFLMQICWNIIKQSGVLIKKNKCQKIEVAGPNVVNVAKNLRTEYLFWNHGPGQCESRVQDFQHLYSVRHDETNPEVCHIRYVQLHHTWNLPRAVVLPLPWNLA